MAVSIVDAKPLIAVPFLVSKIDITGMVAGVPETISHTGPSSVAPNLVQFVMTAPPTDGSIVNMCWDSSSTTNNTVTVRFNSTGSLDGATGSVVCTFFSQATAGLNPP
jgi:hypothetical protein